VDWPWFGRTANYQTIGDRRIPTMAEAGWTIKGTEFIYWRGEIVFWSLES
jgi:hypothetical protein